MRRSSIESKDRHARRGRGSGAVSRVDNSSTSPQPENTNSNNTTTTATNARQQQQLQVSPTQTNQQQQQHQRPTAGNSKVPALAGSGLANFRFLIPKPQAIVIDLLGVLVCRSFMSSSKEFRDFFQHNVLEYLNDNWKQKQLKIMINFFRCSQQSVPDEYKLADREEPKEEQIRQAKKHVIWKLRNDPTNSALSLFMLGITEWGYKNRALSTQIYDDVPQVLKYWKEQAKIPVYVGVGSADFLIMVLSNTNYGNMLPYFNGHMNIMDFDGQKANKDFKKLMALLRCPPDKVLYLTRFRQDCKRAMEMGMQSLIVLRQDFDSHNLIEQLRAKRNNATSIDGTKMARGAGLVSNDTASPPTRGHTQLDREGAKNADLRKQFENNMSSLSLIDDHDEAPGMNAQSSQIVEQDLVRYSIVMSLSEITFK